MLPSRNEVHSGFQINFLFFFISSEWIYGLMKQQREDTSSVSIHWGLLLIPQQSPAAASPIAQIWVIQSE